jgi:hypothetical protein
MSLLDDEKPKNDERPRRNFPYWLVTFVLGFILGAVFILMLSPVHITFYREDEVYSDDVYLTVTYIIDRATQTEAAGKTATRAAELGTILPTKAVTIPPIYLTATYIVGSYTETVQADNTALALGTISPTPTRYPDGKLAPIFMTATAIVSSVTQTAEAEDTATQAAQLGQSTRQPDPLFLTATYLIGRATEEMQATRTAQAVKNPSQSTGQLDPIFLTATYIVDTVTQMAEARDTATRRARATPTPTP